METGTSNGNLNDLSWKDKLEDAAGLWDETLKDKNAAWAKLHNRLSQKSPRTRFKWYVAAAACLLPAIWLTWWASNNQHDTLAKNSSVQTGSQKAPAPEVLPSNEQTLTPASTFLISKNKISKPPIRTIKKYSQHHLKKEGVTANLNVESIIRDQLSASTIINNPVEGNVAVAPPKKKLKVVHINELSEPSPEAPDVARYHEPRSFQLKFINQGAYTSFSLPAGNTEFNIFKTKISPSN